MPAPGPGEVIAGKYRVERSLGQGGMGIVLAARHLHLGHRVAIKFPRSALAQRKDGAARLLREARAAMQIRGPHVAHVFDAGVHDNGAPYFVMEYLQGQDLGSLVQQRGPLAVEAAVEYVLQAVEAVAEAHALGIIHRDLKPSNLFLLAGPDGSPLIKVIDFGLAKVQSITDGNLTETGAMLGSTLFMAPEQMRGTIDLDERVDIWALGATLHALLVGSPPFPGKTLLDVYDRMRAGVPVLTEFREDASGQLAAICQRCLQMDRGDRYRTVADLADALGALTPSPPERSTQRARRILEHAKDPHSFTTAGPVPTDESVGCSTAPPLEPSWAVPESSTGLAATPKAPAKAAQRTLRYGILVALLVAALASWGLREWQLAKGELSAAKATASVPLRADAEPSPSVAWPSPPRNDGAAKMPASLREPQAIPSAWTLASGTSPLRNRLLPKPNRIGVSSAAPAQRESTPVDPLADPD